jgi:ribosomal-protein-alanine N-acetyltransferase
MGELLDRLASVNRFESERLILRWAELDDAADMFELFHDDETVRYIHAPKPDTITDVIENSLRAFHFKNPVGKWVLVEKASGKMIGSIDLRVDEANHSGEIGYAINRHFAGKGYATEAASRVLRLGFETIGLNRVYSFHAPQNPASGRVMVKIGLKYEGTLRQNELLRGEYLDSVFYGLTRDQYQEG